MEVNNMKMCLRRQWRLLAAGCLLCMVFSAYGDAGDRAKTLLKQAVDYSLNAGFQSRNPVSGGVENKDVAIYSGNGKIRIDHPVDQRRRNQTIIISAPPEIKEQVWLTEHGKVVEHLVLERLYPTNWSWWPIVHAMTEPDRIDRGSYRVFHGKYRGIPCDRIVVRYRDDDDTIAHSPPWHFQWKKLREIFGRNSGVHSRGFTREEFDQNISALKSAYFSTIELWVDQTPGRPFIYSFRAWGRNGEMLAAEDWGTVTFVEEIDGAKLFPPDGAKVKSVKNNQEFSEAYIGNFTAGNIEPPSVWSVFVKWTAERAEALWLNILQHGGAIAFWLAVLLITVAAGLKARQKIVSGRK